MDRRRIPNVFQNLVSGKVGVSNLQPPKQTCAKHMVDADGCKDENARAARNQILKHVRYIIRRSLFLPFLLLIACTKSDPWAFQQMETGDVQFNSTKLTHYSKDPVNGIDLELTCTRDHLRTYLNVHSHPVPALKKDPKSSAVNLIIGEEIHPFLARRHEGGQRLLVPEEIATLMISALKDNQHLRITLPGYSATISAEGFEKKYEQLYHQPVFPLHLIKVFNISISNQ